LNPGRTVQYLAARLLLGLLRALPPQVASNAGGFVARAIGPLLPVSAVADANLRAALPGLDSATRKRIVRGVWDNLGRTVAELPHLASLRRNTAAGPGFIVRNEIVLTRLAQLGGPAVFCSAHIGNWEFLQAAAAACGTPFAGMYRAAADPHIDALIQGMRTASVSPSQPLFPKGAAGARQAMKHIASGGRLALLVDQKMNDGIEAHFFGMRAMTAPAAAAFALRVRCPVICGHVERLGPARLCVVVEDPVDLPDSGDRHADIIALTQRINDVLESWIRAKPESWLWLHRRWPKDVVSTKQRRKKALVSEGPEGTSRSLPRR
jgi:KDO2-lipid IV(A) lauroyltransferase